MGAPPTTTLVTGASGFIGGHLVQRLLATGGRVRCLVRASSSLTCLDPSRVEFVRGDLATGAGIEDALRGAGLVFHLAGVTKALDRSAYYTGNVTAAENLARAAAGARRLIHVSSLAAAGPSLPGAPIAEDAIPHPVSEYGKSKLEGEEAVRRWLPGAVIVRPPVVYGPRDTDVFAILRALHSGFDLRIGRAERWFSAIYVADLVDGLLAAASAPEVEGRTYFLAHPQPIAWSEFATTAAHLLNRRARKVVIPQRAAWAAGWMAELWARWSRKPGIFSRDKVAEACWPSWTCDPARACRELGFMAHTSLEDGVGRTLAWYREARWL